MSNIKTFLGDGLYVPFDHQTLSTQTNATLLNLQHTLPRLSQKPFRFILVDSPDNFKPDYWRRVVAVFTTGQTWQFRAYNWTEPQQLFANVQGVYVGEKGQPVPKEVVGWGKGVRQFSVDRWDERLHGQGVDHELRVRRRWRDKEVVEEIWRAIEKGMDDKGDWKGR
jgi:parafibromin